VPAGEAASVGSFSVGVQVIGTDGGV